MSNLSLGRLGERLRKERGLRGIREVAKELGVSPATLSRVERGNVPDIETFTKICRWLDVDPAEILELETARSGADVANPMSVIASAHFRGKQTTSPELAAALAELILAAQSMLESEDRATG